MASPFVGVPVDPGALLVQASLRRQRVFRDRTDPLALSDDIQISDFIVIVQTTKLGFFMRDTDSHQRVFVIWSSFWTLCRQWLLLRIVSPWQSARVEVARQSWISARGVRLPSEANLCEAYNVPILMHMEYLFTKAYGIIFLCLFRTWTHIFKAVLAPHLWG